MIFKRLAYTLNAHCYWSKSVTQLDASSKRYLWEDASSKRYLYMGKNIVLFKSYTKQLGQISILGHCKRQ